MEVMYRGLKYPLQQIFRIMDRLPTVEHKLLRPGPLLHLANVMLDRKESMGPRYVATQSVETAIGQNMHAVGSPKDPRPQRSPERIELMRKAILSAQGTPWEKQCLQLQQLREIAERRFVSRIQWQERDSLDRGALLNPNECKLWGALVFTAWEAMLDLINYGHPNDHTYYIPPAYSRALAREWRLEQKSLQEYASNLALNYEAEPLQESHLVLAGRP